MYQSSADSQNLIAQLRQLLGGGSAPNRMNLNGSADSNPVTPELQALLTRPAPKSTNFLADVLGKGPISGDLSNLSSGPSPTQPAAPQDYVEQFLQQMAGSIGAGNGSGLNQADYEQALKNSAAQIKGAFGAEIGAVKASSANARHQTKRGKKQIKAMYNALGKQYDKAAVNEVAQGQQISNALQNVANTSSGQVKGNSDQLLNEQAALAQGLGVQSALPDIAAAQQAAVANQVGNIQQTGAREASDALSNSGSQQRFLNRSGKNALLEGTNRRADLVEQLQAFLQQNMGKIADIQGQRGQALAANEMSAAKSFGDAAGKANQDTWNQQKDMADLLLSLRGQNAAGAKQQDSQAQQQNSQLMDYLKLLSQSAAATKDPKQIEAVMKYIQDAMNSAAGG